MDDNLENEFMRRGYLLPEGCKDLIDVLKLKARSGHSMELSELKPQIFNFKSKPQAPPTPAPLPPVTREIVVPEKTSVAQLAALLGQKPFRIIADLMQIGVFTTLNQVLDFETIARVARMHGSSAKKEP